MLPDNPRNLLITYPAKLAAWKKFSVFLFFLAIYYAFAPWMYVSIGTVSRLFAFSYIIPAALFWGFKVGVIVTIASSFIVPFVHFAVVGDMYEGGVIGPIFGVIISGLVGYMRDLTLEMEIEVARHEKVEKELLDLKLNLEEEVSNRTGELIAANYELQEVLNERCDVENQMALLSMAIEQASEEVVITNKTGVIEYVNPAFEKITGYSRSEAIGSNLSILKSGEHDQDFYRNMWTTIQCGQIWHGRFVNRKKNGTRLVEDTTISPVYDSRGTITGYVAVKRDVTELEKSEARNRQAQKMEAIGALAGGIAHDFNNILFGMFGYTELAMRYADEQPNVRDALNEVMKGGRRAKELVRQILTFARQRDSKLQPAPVKLVVKEVLNLLRLVLPSTVKIEQDISSDAQVLADPTQIHQVFMNLCTNAQHAMKKSGGILTVTLKDGNIDGDEAAEIGDIKPGEYVFLTVKDTGEGISENILPKIFEPFFTTKEEGEGTGMGLSTTRNIVNDCGGGILVSSVPGEGTVFRVLLPACRNEVQGASVSAIHGLPGGNERIMVVDDEEPLVRMLGEMLTGLGYQVTAFANSIEAFEVFNREPEMFDLIVTDVTMPLLNGLDLTRKMISVRPAMAVIMVTGFSEIVDEARAKEIGARGYLLKPIAIRELAKSVREVLDGQSPGDKEETCAATGSGP